MSVLERLAEARIRQAMEAGAFDHLPGRGQPLRLQENPFEPAEWRAAFHLLRSQGIPLPWIEERRRLLGEIAAVRARPRPPSAAQLQALNRRIRAYNLKVPLIALQLGPLPAPDYDTLEATHPPGEQRSR